MNYICNYICNAEMFVKYTIVMIRFLYILLKFYIIINLINIYV